MNTDKNLLEPTQTIVLISVLGGREEDPDTVRLSTLHASKELEYPHVFPIGVEEDILPHCREDDELTDERIEEERQLIYVGIMRAQRSLHISWHKKRKRTRKTVVCEPSYYIAEVELREGAGPTPEDIIPAASPKDWLGTLKGPLVAEKPVAS